MEHVRAHLAPPDKTADLSMFMSFKSQKHTMHHLRASFMQALADRLGNKVDLFGRNLKFVEHKAEGTDGYRYQIAIENHVAPHHWTEKLSDAYLGYCLPFYFGCPNVSEYFPPESFIGLDINDVEVSVDIIRQAIANNEYEKRLDAIVPSITSLEFVFRVFVKKDFLLVPIKIGYPKLQNLLIFLSIMKF